MKKQILCLFLALLLASMTACASETTDTPTADSTEAVTEAAETEDPFPYTSHLPDADYEGFLFRVMGEEMRDHYESEEQTGEVINDAVYQRNMAVEEKYNIALEYEILPWQSGDDQRPFRGLEPPAAGGHVPSLLCSRRQQNLLAGR